MPHPVHRILTTALLACATNLSLAQNVVITYLNPPGMSVCDTATFSATLSNTLAGPLASLQFMAAMPAGLSYVAGSLSIGSELNVATPNAPAFSLPDLPAGASHTLSWKVLANCALIDSINGGALFSNTYTATYVGGSKTASTAPYLIETALLQSLDLSSASMSGVSGDVLTRTWTLTNTRLGALRQLTFRDEHEPGIEVSSNTGTLLSALPGQLLELSLSGSDFAAVGDGDELFELDEAITITETILVTGCGSPPVSSSLFSATWGCNGQVCQVLDAFANVFIQPSTANPELTDTVLTPFPADYCAAMPHLQQLLLKNEGELPAANVTLNLDHGLEALMGVVPGSLNLTVNGTDIPVMPVLTQPLQFATCPQTGALFSEVKLIIPHIGPGESALVSWEAFVCATGCGANLPRWDYDFEYAKACPPDESDQQAGSWGATYDTLPIEQFTQYYIGELLADNESYTLTYTLQSPFLTDSAGVLRVDFKLPCGIKWGNNANFMLAGQSPDSLNSSALPDGSDEITMYFTLPLALDSVGSDFSIGYQCQPLCTGPPPPCDLLVVSSCGGISNGIVGSEQVEVSSTFMLDGSGCEPKDCESFQLSYYCEDNVTNVCTDTILGYFVHSGMEFQRKNLGLPDNDDDRLQDPPGGQLDENLIRRDRALTGDTLRTRLNAAMHLDVPGASLPGALFVVSFSSHTDDDEMDGGITLDFDEDKALMVDSTGFQHLVGRLRFTDVSAGTVFECSLPLPVAHDTLRGSVAVVNTQPSDVLDEWILLQYVYDISPENLASLGCAIPSDWAFEEGDSVEAEVFHRILRNTGAQVNNLRTETNFLAFDPDGPHQQNGFACDTSFLRWQLSGYEYEVVPGTYELPPCEPSDLPGGTHFSFRLGMGNFFPFEFRPLAILDAWAYTLPPAVSLLSSELMLFEVQGGPILAADVPLNAVQNGLVHDFDLAPLQSPLADEGFVQQFRHLWSVPCTESQWLKIGVSATIDLAGSLPEPNPALVELLDTNAIFPLQPPFELTPASANYLSTDGEALWELHLSNAPAENAQTAENAWLYLHPPMGALTNFLLTNLNTGDTLTVTGGIFQLGNLPPGWSANLQLQASVTGCDPGSVELSYGWSCSPLTDSIALADACSREDIVLSMEVLLGEIEMDVASPTGAFDLCDTIPYHTVELFNAQPGAVFDLLLEAELPPGLLVLPGSCQVAYPSGTDWQPLADPADLGNGSVQWNLSDLLPPLDSNGLPGFDHAPFHSVSVRFQSLTGCGFVTPSQVIFDFRAMQGCGIEANHLSKPGGLLFIEGVPPLYNTGISIATGAQPGQGCGGNLLLEVTIETEASTAPTDSVFIFLPPGVAYLPGSYLPLQNATATEPATDSLNGLLRLKLPLPGGLPPFSPIIFRLELSPSAGKICDSVELRFATYQRQEALCTNTGQTCSLLLETAHVELPIWFEMPMLHLESPTLFTGGGGDTLGYSLTLSNTGFDAEPPFRVDFYYDADGSGTLSPGDLPLHSHTESTVGLPSGDSLLLSGSFLAPAAQLCLMLAVLDTAHNCTCEVEVLPLAGSVVNVWPPANYCGSYQYNIGIVEEEGHVYQWSPNTYLDCSSCATTNFYAYQIPNDLLPQTLLYTLTDTDTVGCSVQHHLTLHIGGSDIEGWGIYEACEGDTLYLNGNWYSGPGILLPDAVILTGPGNGSWLQSSVIDTFGCYATFEMTVSVVPAHSETETDTLTRCHGDSVLIEGVAYYDDVLECETVFVGPSCPQERCTYWYFLPDSGLFPLDTVYTPVGVDVEISPPLEGFVNYEWSFPPNTLNCRYCSHPTAPGETMSYGLLVTDANGCADSGSVQVIALPACSPGFVKVPNVFTPNADLLNDSFAPVYPPRFDQVLLSAHLRIYDRWGNLVFDEEGTDVRWDGQFKGEPMPSEVYIYLLEIACAEGDLVMKGDVTLLR